MYDYSEFQVTPTDDVLELVVTLVDEQEKLDLQITELSAKLEKLQARRNEISSRNIPELLEEFPQTRFELPDCRVVEIVENMRTSISKQNEDVAFAYIIKQGRGDIIKREMTFTFAGKDAKLAEKFERDLKARKQRLNYKQKRTVHHLTLAAFVRDQLAAGHDVPKMEFNLFRQKETKVS